MSGKPRPAQKPVSQPFASHGDMVGLAIDSCRLWIDSWAVITMRSNAILTNRPGSEREAVRMMTEKWHAGIELAGKLAVAPHNPLRTSVDYLSPRVRANRERLERRK